MTKDYVASGKPGVVVREEGGQRVSSVMRWGFPHNGKPVTNVRNYTSPFWRSALQNPERRCLVPVTEFQEWSVEPVPLILHPEDYDGWLRANLEDLLALACAYPSQLMAVR